MAGGFISRNRHIFFDYALPVLYVKRFFETGASDKLHICNHYSQIYDNIVFFRILIETVYIYNNLIYLFIFYILAMAYKLLYILTKLKCTFNLPSGGYSNARYSLIDIETKTRTTDLWFKGKFPEFHDRAYGYAG